MNHRELTVKEYAERERVTTRTVKTWISKGAVQVRRTPGGRVRILILGAAEVKDGEAQGSLAR